MAIVRKNREFSKIMDDVEVTTIPIMFIKKLTIFLDNDKKIYFESHDLRDFDNLETFLYNVSISENIIDINIELNLSVLEKTIEQQVKILLDKDSDD